MDYLLEKLSNAKVVLWGGADGNEKDALAYLLENGIRPLYCINDNQALKTVTVNENTYSIPVYDLNVLNNEDKSGVIVVITLKYPLCSKIVAQLSQLGIQYCFYSKNITTCDLLQHHLGFYNDKIGFCCGAHNNFHKELPLFPYLDTAEETITHMLQVREDILKGLNNIGNVEIAKSCANCCRLHIIPHHLSDIGYGIEKLSLINISCYPSVCQAKCVYCSVPLRKTNTYEEAKHSIYPKMITQMIEHLQKNNLLDENCRFEFAPAEITITPFKDVLLNATAGYDSTFLTNGFIFDAQIADSLNKNDSELRLSLDSGTRQTFELVKGRDFFDTVVENLKNYRKHGRIELKYNILPGINDSNENITGIINILKELNLEYIRLSFDYELPIRTAFYGIVKFVKELEKNDLSFLFHVYYTSEEIKRVIDNYWNADLQKYYEQKVRNLSKFFNINESYQEYRKYVYLVEIKDLIAHFHKGVRFAFLGNHKSHMGQWVLEAFNKLKIPVQILNDKDLGKSCETLNPKADIFLICDSNGFDGSPLQINLEKEQRVLNIKNYFYSLEPMEFFVERNISPAYLEKSHNQRYSGSLNIIRWLKKFFRD